MKIWLVTAVALALCAPGVASAQMQQHVITMSGHGEAQGQPDTATLSAGVSVDAPTAAAALSTNNKRMEAVIAAIRRLGVPDKDIRTSNFSVSLQYANSNNEPPRVTGYQAGNQVEVRLEDVNKLGIVLDGLVTAGANQMHGVSFLIRNDTDLLSRARTAAVAEARAKAQTFATAAGVTLGPILSIIENGNSGPRPVFFAAAKATTASVPVALGEETISADVTITWEIK